MVTPLLIVLLLSFPLIGAFLFARVKRSELDIGQYACRGLGLAFLYFFVGHMVKTEGMVEMLPPWIPLRLEIVYATGILELLIGIALFFPRTQVTAARLAIVVFVVFFPANIYAAINGIGLGGHQWGPVYLLIRAPLQIILIVWTYFLCIRRHATSIHPTPRASLQ